MSDNDFVYRVTYANGNVSATCSARALAGKIGYSNSSIRRHRKLGYYSWPGHVIAKIERAPLQDWADVTGNFPSLEQIDV